MELFHWHVFMLKSFILGTFHRIMCTWSLSQRHSTWDHVHVAPCSAGSTPHQPLHVHQSFGNCFWNRISLTQITFLTSCRCDHDPAVTRKKTGSMSGRSFSPLRHFKSQRDTSSCFSVALHDERDWNNLHLSTSWAGPVLLEQNPVQTVLREKLLVLQEVPSWGHWFASLDVGWHRCMLTGPRVHVTWAFKVNPAFEVCRYGLGALALFGVSHWYLMLFIDGESKVDWSLQSAPGPVTTALQPPWAHLFH